MSILKTRLHVVLQNHLLEIGKNTLKTKNKARYDGKMIIINEKYHTRTYEIVFG